MLVIPVSATIMFFTYSRIFSHARESSKTLQKHKEQSENGQSQRTFSDRDLQLMKTLIIMFLVYFFANLPWFIVVAFDFDDSAHQSLYYLTVWSFHTGSTLNPLIYAANYPQFRRCFKVILKKLLCGFCINAEVGIFSTSGNPH